MIKNPARIGLLLISALLLLPAERAEATHSTFAPGDVFVSLESGEVQWRHPDGTLNRVLVGLVQSNAEGMGFDADGNLYVTHWCGGLTCAIGNTVEVFNTQGQSLGEFGSDYNCNPHAIVFDAAGSAYVGQSDCTGAILKFEPSKAPIAFAVAPENRGSFWVALGADQCTIFYTSWGPNVKRFDVCANVQLPDFNVAPLPGGETHDLRILADGGVLVSSGQVIARLDASGALVQTYGVTGESSYWAGLDLVGDGTFWAANYYSSNVYRFDLATGAVLSSFNAATPLFFGIGNVVGVSVKKGPGSGPPALPQVLLDTTYTPQGGTTHVVGDTGNSVTNGSNFQAKLDQAQPGDIIQLEANGSYTGNFVLRNKGSGTSWIYIQTSAYGSLPLPGSRVFPSDAIRMPKIVSPNRLPALRTEASGHHYRFVGIEITTTHSATTSTHDNLIALHADGGQTSLSQVPTDIVFDRCYIHGTPTGNIRRGIAMNSARTAVIDSYLSDFHATTNDSQAIISWNGPGPFKIVNNYLEAAGENVMFGGECCGDDPPMTNLVPSDIEIRGNYFFKPLTWKQDDPSYAGIPWTVETIFELKNAQRVLVEGNVFKNNWKALLKGFAVLFSVRNMTGGAPWSVVQDVTFVKNILDTEEPVPNTFKGITISGVDNNWPSQQTKRILIKDNLFDQEVGGMLFQLIGTCSPTIPPTCVGAADVVIDHNTLFHDSSNIISFDDWPFGTPGSHLRHTGFVYRNNISEIPDGIDGVAGNETAEGTDTLEEYAPGYVFVKNVLQDPVRGASACSSYPPDNFCHLSWDEVGFLAMANRDYRLRLDSPYKNAGTDGKDIGADIDALGAATAGAISGSSGF